MAVIGRGELLDMVRKSTGRIPKAGRLNTGSESDQVTRQGLQAQAADAMQRLERGEKING